MLCDSLRMKQANRLTIWVHRRRRMGLPFWADCALFALSMAGLVGLWIVTPDGWGG